MKTNKSFFGIFLAVLVLLPGCILHVPSYRRQPLRMIRENFTYSEVEKNVMLRAKLLSDIDKQDLFTDRIGAIEGEEFKVVYVSIHNLSDKNYILIPHRIDLRQMSCNNVVGLMKKTSSVGRLATYVFSGIVSKKLFILSATAGIASANVIALSVVASTVGVGLEVISLIGLFRGIKSIVMNRRISRDLKEKTLHEKIIINSGQQYDGLIFVKSCDYTPQFAVTMHENNNKKNTVTFDVDLHQNKSCVLKMHEEIV